MVKDIHFPTSISGLELDNYLSMGWYRMGQTIFTADIMQFNVSIHTLHWLRIAINKIYLGRSQQKIVNKNKDLDVRISPFLITDEIEDLYALYKDAIDFNVSPSAASYLLDGAASNMYDTRTIEIRLGCQLIAVGYFDVGNNSIAGILNFYHPLHKTRSLGKYLMLLKIGYAMQHFKTWYYLGYIANGYPKFDYKLFPDIIATEVYDSWNNIWRPFSWPLSDGILSGLL